MGFSRQEISYSKLGGMRTDKPLTDFEPHEAVDARNTRTSTSGKIMRRLGGAKFNPTQYAGVSNIQGIYQFNYGTSSSKILTVENGILYSDDGSTQTSLATGLDDAAFYNFETANGYCIITNGVDTPKKYNGTTVTNLSMAVPAAAPVLDSQTTGGSLTLLATYGYVATFYNSTTGQESNPCALSSALSVTLTGSNCKINLKTIPVSADSQVTARRIYRTTGNGSIYAAQLLTTINDNSTTTYSDTTADSALGMIIDLTNDPAPIFQKVVLFNNKLIGFKKDDSTLYIGSEGEIWSFPQAITDQSLGAWDFTIPVREGDGDFITNIVKYYDFLLIFKNRSIHLLSGYGEVLSDNTLNFQLKQLEFMFNVGCVGFRAAKVVANWCYFIDQNGVYRTNGQIIDYVGKPMQGFFDSSSILTYTHISSSNLSNAIVEVDNKKPLNCLRFAVPSANSSLNDITFVFNYIDEQWTYDTGYITTSLGVVRISGEDTLLRGDDYGFIFRENSATGEGAIITSTSTGSNTSATLNDTGQSMTVNLYKGCYIEILSGTSIGERFRILSNTATAFTIDGTWATTPDTTSVYTVGSIDFFYQHRWDDMGNPSKTKRLQFIRSRIDSIGSYNMNAYYLYDFQQPGNYVEDSIVISAGSTWDSAIWDLSTWDSALIQQNLERPLVADVHNYNSVAFGYKASGQDVQISGYDKIFQVKGWGIRPRL